MYCLVCLLLIWKSWTIVSSESSYTAYCAPHNTSLVLVILEGFRADYVDNEAAENLHFMRDNGVSSYGVVPSYPTNPLSTLISLVTGNFSESHGLIANEFKDTFLKNFNYTEKKLDSLYWKNTEPIWNTATKQNKITAVSYCPGGNFNIKGIQPKYHTEYDPLLAYSDRIEQVIKWLRGEEGVRPDFISICLKQPYGTSYHRGPKGVEMSDTIRRVDMLIGKLLKGIEDNQLCANIMIVSNLGLCSGSEQQVFYLNTTLPHIMNKAKFLYAGEPARITPQNTEELSSVLKILNRQHNQCNDEYCVHCFWKYDLPEHFHFINHHRIDPLICLPKEGYSITLNHNTVPKMGKAGYDNYLKSMRTLFIAYGPDFQNGVKLPHFQSVELYNLMCDILKIKPSPNDGTLGALYAAMKNPPTYPPSLKNTNLQVVKVPQNNQLLQMRLHAADCPDDFVDNKFAGLDLFDQLLEFETNHTIRQDEREDHAPFGIPIYNNKKLNYDFFWTYNGHCLIGFSRHYRMVKYLSFTMTEQPNGFNTTYNWTTDIRLPSGTGKCKKYDRLEEFEVAMAPLLHPGFLNNGTLEQTVFLVTNAVPMADEAIRRWTELTQLILEWTADRYPTNIILGTIHRQSPRKNWKEIPSHFYAIITFCKEEVEVIYDCPEDQLENRAFMYPNRVTMPTNMNATEYASLHACTVNDIERRTGMAFYQSLESRAESIRLSLNLPFIEE